MTTATKTNPETVKSKDALENLLESRREKLAAAQQKGLVLEAKTAAAKQEWVKASIDSGPGEAAAKKKYETLEAEYDEILFLIDGYQTALSESLKDPAVQQLALKAIDEYRAEFEKLARNKQKLIEELFAEKEGICNKGLKVYELHEMQEQQRREAEHINHQINGRKAAPLGFKLVRLGLELPFFKEIRAAVNSDKARPRYERKNNDHAGPLNMA
jgi:hypothetical protein